MLRGAHAARGAFSPSHAAGHEIGLLSTCPKTVLPLACMPAAELDMPIYRGAVEKVDVIGE